MSDKREVATLAGGCFWCVEAVFQDLIGVEKVVSGYIGGQIDNPTYQQICTGMTGHAEATEITFDPELISFADLLYIFWRTHDPTTLNRQGNDVGTQYRSAIFYHSEEQKRVSEESLRETDAASVWADPIVTEISPASKFYEAEDYHQNYYKNNRYQPYCRVIIDPKIRKLRKSFANKLKQPA
ncbi:MAG: peptide-methionine (S)-S-oxide reductase MsrA [Chloroflexota bacterium]